MRPPRFRRSQTKCFRPCFATAISSSAWRSGRIHGDIPAGRSRVASIPLQLELRYRSRKRPIGIRTARRLSDLPFETERLRHAGRFSADQALPASSTLPGRPSPARGICPDSRISVGALPLKPPRWLDHQIKSRSAQRGDEQGQRTAPRRFCLSGKFGIGRRVELPRNSRPGLCASPFGRLGCR